MLTIKLEDTISLTDRLAVEAAVDADIRAFDEWFQQVAQNTPLVGPERSIVKTYLYWKIFGKEKPYASENG